MNTQAGSLSYVGTSERSKSVQFNRSDRIFSFSILLLLDSSERKERDWSSVY